jgi:hypothetical protein
MSDTVIAAIGRRVAVAASNRGRERTPDATKEFLAALTELCAAVRTEQIDLAKPAE